jgi:thiol:disulfide interchange protein
MESYTDILLALPFLISLFFWGRGLRKGNRGDLLLGVLLLLLAAFLAMAVVGHSGVISFIGGFFLLFGIVSILMRKDAAEKKIMSKSGVILIAILLIVLGILASMVI